MRGFDSVNKTNRQLLRCVTHSNRNSVLFIGASNNKPNLIGRIDCLIGETQPF
jgi:hypothetical protein